MKDKKDKRLEVAEKFFSKAIDAAMSENLIPWEPTRRMMHALKKNGPAKARKILNAMKDFFVEKGYIPTWPKLEKINNKWHISFSSDKEGQDEIINIRL